MKLIDRVGARLRGVLDSTDRLRQGYGGQAGRRAASVPATRLCVVSTDQWYAPSVAGASTIGARALDEATIRRAASVLERVPDDSYRRFVAEFYRIGLERCGASWQYADINTVLIAAAELLQPEAYLEIGVRTGRSMSMVSAVVPRCRLVGFDLWIPDYAGMDNPGPDFVKSFLAEHGHIADIEFVRGDSRETVPEYFRTHEDQFFDLITVDGDHSDAGARADLQNVVERLKIGGVLVFDDVSNPGHPSLADVWRDFVTKDSRLSSWSFDEVGFGVACAVRLR